MTFSKRYHNKFLLLSMYFPTVAPGPAPASPVRALPACPWISPDCLPPALPSLSLLPPCSAPYPHCSLSSLPAPSLPAPPTNHRRPPPAQPMGGETPARSGGQHTRDGSCSEKLLNFQSTKSTYDGKVLLTRRPLGDIYLCIPFLVFGD